MEELHIPVLLSQVVGALDPQPGQSYLDLTAGYGGHAKSILDVTRNYKDATLVDRDANAIKYLQEKFAGKPVQLVHKSFYSAALQEIECGKTYDMILADFGVSSPQLDQPERGFAFKTAGPLDMRMDPGQDLTAEQIINKWSEKNLTQIFVEYGEVSKRWAEKIAKVIVHGRPWRDTKQLAEAIVEYARHGKVHPATRIFQAIRIAVNDELGQIEQTLPLLPKLLNPGGRVALITFHSLEDRLVKQYFKNEAQHGEEASLTIITKKPIVAESTELVINPRARSAKLRVATKN